MMKMYDNVSKIELKRRKAVKNEKDCEIHEEKWTWQSYEKDKIKTEMVKIVKIRVINKE